MRDSLHSLNNLCLRSCKLKLAKIEKIHATSDRVKRTSPLPFPDPAGGVVDALVALPPAAVLEEVLDGRHAEHEEHRHHRDLLPERVDLRHPVVG